MKTCLGHEGLQINFVGCSCHWLRFRSPLHGSVTKGVLSLSRHALSHELRQIVVTTGRISGLGFCHHIDNPGCRDFTDSGLEPGFAMLFHYSVPSIATDFRALPCIAQNFLAFGFAMSWAIAVQSSRNAVSPFLAWACRTAINSASSCSGKSSPA